MTFFALLVIVGIIFVASYWHANRVAEDESDLERFTDEEGSAQLPEDKNYLEQFDRPIWKALKLDYCSPGLVVKRNVEGVEYTVLELKHASAALLATHTQAYTTKTTTIFIAKLPEARDDWKVNQTLGTYRTWVDSRHAYLARLNKKIPVKEWEAHLDLLAKVVRSIQKKTPFEKETAKDERVWNIQDGRWALFWIIIAGFAPAIMASIFSSEWNHFQTLGYIKKCDSQAQYASLLTGTQAWLYLALLALPPLGLIKVIYTITQHFGRPNYVLRLSVESILLIGASFLCISLIFNAVKWQPPHPGVKQVLCRIPG